MAKEETAVPAVLTIREAAEQLRMSYTCVWMAVRSGEIPSVRVGRIFRIFRDDIVPPRKAA